MDRNDNLSVGIDGKEYRVPTKKEEKDSFDILKKRAIEAKESGKEIVVVQGLGFVGVAMSLVIANAGEDNYPFFVIGVDRRTFNSYWKIGMINEGRCPIVSADPKVEEYLETATKSRQNFAATSSSEAYGIADIVIVDVNLDVKNDFPVENDEVRVGIENIEGAAETLGKNINSDALVIVETTVPPGTTENVILPTLKSEFKNRGINVTPKVAHSYERVMPGKHYIDSIENFWRVYSADTQVAEERAKRFFSKIIDTKDYPLTKLSSPKSSETAKVLENTYRASNIAFIQEWTEFAEKMGLNLFEVIEAIKKRDGTHDNIMYPGFGVGGYCLPEDPLLAVWGSERFLDDPPDFKMAPLAQQINYKMPQHSFLRLKQYFESLKGKNILTCGVAYKGNVKDTRNSPTALFYDLLNGADSSPIFYDPYVKNWPERQNAKFVDFEKGLKTSDAVIFAVPHDEFKNLSLDYIIENFEEGVVLDTFDLFSDKEADRMYENGITPLGLGKGHWMQKYEGGSN